MDRYYRDTITETKTKYAADVFFSRYKKQEYMTLIKKWGGDCRNKRVLKTDVYEEAIGAEHFLLWLAGRGGNVFGMDISPKIVALAQEATKPQDTRFVASDIRKAAFKSEAFDIIISNSTIDHFKDIGSALQELYRILKPNGTLILTLHNKFNFPFYLLILSKRIFHIHDFLYGYSYSIKEARQKLESVGFRVEECTSIVHTSVILQALFSRITRLGKQLIYKRLIRLQDKIGKANIWLRTYAGLFIALKATK